MTKTVWILHHATEILAYENTRLLECLQKNGFEGRVLEPKYFDIIVSRSSSKSIRYKGEKIDMPNLVLSRTGSATNYFTLALMRQIEKFGIPVINDSESISRVSDKLFTSQLLVKENLPIPKQYWSRVMLMLSWWKKKLAFLVWSKPPVAARAKRFTCAKPKKILQV